MPSLEASLFQCDNRARTHDVPYGFERTGPSYLQAGSWDELKAALVRELKLDQASFQLMPNFGEGSEATALGDISVCHIDRSSVLLEFSVGLEARLVVRLIRSAGSLEGKEVWPPSRHYVGIGSKAMELFASSLNSEAAGQFARRNAAESLTVYLRESGALEFCASSTESWKEGVGLLDEDDCLVPRVADYLARLISLFEAKASRLGSYTLSFCMTLEMGVARCLLRKLEGGGYSLIIWKSDATL